MILHKDWMCHNHIQSYIRDKVDANFMNKLMIDIRNKQLKL